MSQAEGVLGKLVEIMIRRSVRSRFRNVYWEAINLDPGKGPYIFAANHHGWMDGYLMFHLITKLGIRSLDWIAEFDSFPLFAKIGGLRYPADDSAARSATIRKTIRLMQTERRSLVIFPEAHLHRGPELLEFGRALELVATKISGAKVIPVAIKYEYGLHERPEAFIRVGLPMVPGENLCQRTRDEVRRLLAVMEEDIRVGRPSEIMVKGTGDVNERMDMRRAPWKRT